MTVNATTSSTHAVEFFRHAIRDADIAAVSEVLRSVFLTTGPRTADFESQLADYLGVQDVIAVSSCTAALFLSLAALGIGPGDEVITTPLTFIATANTIVHVGATPVFVDVEYDTGNIHVDLVEQAITERTAAIVPVHLYGAMADMTRLADVGKRYGIPIIEDAAHALEAERDGSRPGNVGTTACFSFYATKNITSGEGGAIATNDSQLGARLRQMRLHGMSKSAADRYTSKYQHWDMHCLGYKANLSDIQSALLIGQLGRVGEQLARRDAIAQVYEHAFSKLPGVGFPLVKSGCKSARHLFTIWVDTEKRDDMLAQLQDQRVGIAVNYRPIHQLTYYRETFGCRNGMYPNAESIGSGTITLPLYPDMTDHDVDAVIRAVAKCVAT